MILCATPKEKLQKTTKSAAFFIHPSRWIGNEYSCTFICALRLFMNTVVNVFLSAKYTKNYHDCLWLYAKLKYNSNYSLDLDNYNI